MTFRQFCRELAENGTPADICRLILVIFALGVMAGALLLAPFLIVYVLVVMSILAVLSSIPPVRDDKPGVGMATRINEYRVDDLALASDPAAETLAGETVRFALGKDSYEIDLCDANAARLRQAMDPYVRVARRVGPPARPRPRADRRQSAEIRDWAKARGIEVMPKGRIPGEVVAQFRAAGQAVTA